MSKKNRNRAFVNVDELVVDGDQKVEINENPTLFTKVNTEPQKHETIITAPKEEVKEEIKEEMKPVFEPVVEEKKEEPAETVEVEKVIIEPIKEVKVQVEPVKEEPKKEVEVQPVPVVEEAKEQPKKRVVAVPCVTKNVKAVDLIAQQHGYAVNINLPRI